ncbi:cyclic nucleotide-binding domain-containing protein [Cognatazoarcus halotolerans]|uniref:cyclic nucleotide-binding domain-containing protein n=1 Tax=Cognatazoarcus halotolerans TaxID=2686016 RepID=UPI001357DA17|nr:cyclic nucleotide-binding domain-containing protein [Cognatazoarcus halotolerans]MCB1898168.1 cyclic nucleotide-binding domain-containing protein [Rhodocyclaceae bacterium]
MDQTRVAQLQAMAIFGGVRGDVLELLDTQSREMSREAGEFFVREGEAGDLLYVLLEGQVEVIKAFPSGPRRLRCLGPGDCFGEMALMDMSRRSASVRALSACRALEIPAAGLLRVYERDVEQFALLEMNMGREVSRRLRETDAHLFDPPHGAE